MATVEELMGADIAHIADLKRSATGDLDRISGLANVRNALYHRLITEPGSLIHRPTYGVGIMQYQNSVNSIGTQRRLAIKIRDQFLEDSRVEDILGVRMENTDADPSLVSLVIRVKIAGYGESSFQFTPFGEGI